MHQIEKSEINNIELEIIWDTSNDKNVSKKILSFDIELGVPFISFCVVLIVCFTTHKITNMVTFFFDLIIQQSNYI